MSKRLCIYHGGCWDGFCAAWLFRREFPDIDLLPANHGDTPPDVTGKTVYVVDFSYKRAVLEAMSDKADLLVVLDHHKTAQTELEGLWYCTFDMSKSGGRLAWEYINKEFHGKTSGYIDAPPWLVLYTEDRDLWNWEMDSSREVNAALRSHPLDFDLWDSWYEDMPETFEAEGAAILRDQANTVAAKTEQSHVVSVGQWKWNVANATTLMSETAQALAAADNDVGCCWFEFPDGSRLYSLRSVRDSNIDVSEIATSFGGGGHFNAAGFKLPPKSRHPWTLPPGDLIRDDDEE